MRAIKIYGILVGLCLAFQLPGQLILRSSTISNGAEEASSASYTLNTSVGQTLAGKATSDSYQLSAGFLPTAIAREAELNFTAFTIPEIDEKIPPGGQFSLTFTIRNGGGLTAFGEISVNVYLSANDVLNGGDIRLETLNVTSDLADGASVSFPVQGAAVNIDIPEEATPGLYFVFIEVDPDGIIDEINESNNLSSLQIEVGVSNTSDTQAPSVSLQTSVFDASQPISAEITDNLSSVQSATLSYRPITGEDFITVALEPGSGNIFSITPEDSWADELGMEGFISAEDASGNDIETPEIFYLYREIPDNTAIPLNAQSFDGKAATYKMFSIPYELDDNDMISLFALALGGYDDDVYRVFHYSSNEYMELSGRLRTIALGKGYWFNTSNKNFSIEVGSGSVAAVNQTEPFSINFQQGWNQMGNPYPFAVDWVDIQAANTDRGLGSLFTFENGSYRNASLLAPWEGAFVFCENAGAVSFPLSAKSGARTARANPFTQEGWFLELALSYGTQTHLSAVGMHPEASWSKDRFDEIAVPRFISYLEMSSYHEEYFAPRFAYDVVPESAGHTWTFDLASNDESGQAQVSWNKTMLSKIEGTCYLLDLTYLKLINMSLVDSYAFEWKNDRQLQVIYSSDGSFAPDQLLIGTAYPNPFKQLISIPVLISDADQPVEMRIYDASGKLVYLEQKRFETEGLHEVTWDGSSAECTEVTEGIYFCELSISGERKMIRVMKE